MKRYLVLVIILILTLTSCSTIQPVKSDKLTIVTTVFPYYDFAKQLAGENAEVILLLPPGTDSHSFEPTTKLFVQNNFPGSFP